MYRDGRTFSFSVAARRSSPSVRHGPRVEGRRSDDEALPGDRLRDAEHGLSVGHDHRHAVRARAGPAPLRDGDRARHPADHALERDLLRVRPVNAAGWSRAIVFTLLRHDLGFKGVTITDALNAAAATRHLSSNSLAIRAARAGTDLLLLTGSESSTRSVYATLLAQAKSGGIASTTLVASYTRILALKAALPTP